MKFKQLVGIISDTNHVLQLQALKSVNIHLTLRNWLFGMYIVEFEQDGEDRATYGEKLLNLLADSLTEQKIKGMSVTNLKIYRQFYTVYCQIGQTLSAQLSLNDLLTGNYDGLKSAVNDNMLNLNYITPIGQTVSDQLELSNSISDNYNDKNEKISDNQLNINKVSPIGQTVSDQLGLSNSISDDYGDKNVNSSSKLLNINNVNPIGQTASAQLGLNNSMSDDYDDKTENSSIKQLNINKVNPIGQTASAQFNLNEIKRNYPAQKKSFEIIEQVIIKQLSRIGQTASDLSVPPALLLQRLSFSHFVELMQIDEHLKRTFYEIECIKGTWNVRELKRQINSLLFDRLGLSKNKKKALAHFRKNTETITAQDINRDPHVFEFIGLKPKEVFTEQRLEDALMEHLQEFLLEMGKGFLFEARQKRIQIDNEYFYVDMVLYHRFLRCHVLIELKNREFQYADIAQLNTYLNYFKKYETTPDENPPIGILLCTNKSETLVEFATAGIDNLLFITKYQLALPSKQQLQQLIQEELKNLINR